MGLSVKCPHCRHKVGNTNQHGEVHLKVRAVTIKPDGTVVVFCKGCYQSFSLNRKPNQERRIRRDHADPYLTAAKP